MLRPGKFASPAPARTSTSKLSSPKVTSKRRRIYYAGIQSIPATGLSPVRHAALWAANEEHEGARRVKRVFRRMADQGKVATWESLGY